MTENAYTELMEFLEEGETVEAVVFGEYGWGEYEHDFMYDPDDHKGYPVPQKKQQLLLTLAESKPYLKKFKFHGGFGSPECHATYIWTNSRIIWITQYDGATNLSSAPRNPTACKPEIYGG